VGAAWSWRSEPVRRGLVVLLLLILAWGGWHAWLAWRSRHSLAGAQAAFAAGRYATALDAAREFLGIKPGDPWGSLLAARSLSRLERDDEADLYFRQAGKFALEDQKKRAVLLVQQGRVDRAISVLRDILRLDPRDPDALRQLSAIHQSRGEYLLAEGLAERLVNDPESEVVGQSLLGTIHHELATQRVETPGAAIVAFERVLELDPELRRTPIQPKRLFWDFLARDLIAEGRTAEARKHLERALALGLDPGLLELLGQTYWSEGKLDQARECWEQALKLDPSKSDPWIDLGQLALRKDRNAEAIEYLNRALKLSPNSVNPLYKLLQAHRRLGHDGQADQIQRKLDSLRSTPHVTSSSAR
jgi:tetratricopeptide (TPR) repeat protein